MTGITGPIDSAHAADMPERRDFRKRIERIECAR